ncbi:MAG: NAD-dependent epimerase/dehydratase family protein [Gammaproteobacteria bacterium]|nr:NAD-dependent epimerase/dehydratase family protein [Gammaproteobacteria bacterium]
MHRVLVLGAGKIGSLITCLLADSGEYDVHLVERSEEASGRLRKTSDSAPYLKNLTFTSMDATNEQLVSNYIKKTKPEAIISALPYYCNPMIAKLARDNETHYLDLTEDVNVTNQVKALSKNAKTAFVPQCGLAPGFISIVANDLMQQFDSLDTVKMRVGALPVNPSNVLKYSLTWSTDGLINEYGNPCQAIEHGEAVVTQPLEGYETITLDGLLYEAFNTSGGLGSLANTYVGKIHRMNYKTLRYPGHCGKIQLLMNELRLNENRGILKQILENAIPKTTQDVVLIYVSVSGMRNGQLYEKNFVQKIYPQEIAGILWSAIQITTAAGICGVLDLVLENPKAHQGFVTQESFQLQDFLTNRFGQYYSTGRT